MTGDDLLRARLSQPGEDEAFKGQQASDGRSPLRRQLDATLDVLGAEELMVIGLLARRLLAGQGAYGHLDLANDPRDLEAERGDEIADALVYGAMAELKRILARRKGGG